MTKFLLTVTLFVASICAVNAQSKIGVNLNPSLDRDFSNTFWRKLSGGLMYESCSYGRLSFRGIVNFDNNYVEPVDRISLHYYNQFVLQKEIQTNMLSLEADVKFQILKNDSKSSLYFSLGPQFRFLLSGYYVSYFNETFKISPAGYHTLSIFTGVGYSYKITDKLNIFVEPVFGLPILNKRSYRWSLGLKMGVCFDLG
jgi:hypothetical protein